MLILHNSELWEIVNNTIANLVTVPTVTTTKAIFDKKETKTKRILLNALKDHVIPHVLGKDYAHQMWTALINLYQSSNENWKMVLREKLKSIR